MFINPFDCLAYAENRHSCLCKDRESLDERSEKSLLYALPEFLDVRINDSSLAIEEIKNAIKKSQLKYPGCGRHFLAHFQILSSKFCTVARSYVRIMKQDEKIRAANANVRAKRILKIH